jgi:hypothetical protein
MTTKLQIQIALNNAIKMSENMNDESGFEGVIEMIDDAWGEDSITDDERQYYYGAIENYL